MRERKKCKRMDFQRGQSKKGRIGELAKGGRVHNTTYFEGSDGDVRWGMGMEGWDLEDE